MADKIVPVAEKRLVDVKLGELGSWLGTRDFTPNGILASIRKGHDRYYNKYINVRKGGIGGVAMLLAGYVALSYVWEFEHLSEYTLEGSRSKRPLESSKPIGREIQRGGTLAVSSCGFSERRGLWNYLPVHNQCVQIPRLSLEVHAFTLLHCEGSLQ
uniref:ATP synthase membrane subunit f n=1 Tax=Esox lucius TaxID=8010 RepID=A0AAY5KGS6_ESOLU